MKMKNLVKTVLVLLYSDVLLSVICLFLPSTNILNVLEKGVESFLLTGLLLFFIKVYKNYENDETSIW